MTLEQSLSQKQRLTLTTSLQQSIQVLQMDSLSLRNFLIDRSLENPLFHVADLPIDSRSNWTDMLSVSNAETANIYQYLLRQVEFRYKNGPLHEALITLIGFLNPNGLLDATDDEIIRLTGLSRESYEDALTLLQSFDPVGVGARSIQETLIIQAESDTNTPAGVIEILRFHYDAFLKNRSKQICKALDLTSGDYLIAHQYIGELNPRPAGYLNVETVVYQIPDIILTEKEHHYRLSITKFGRPELVYDGKDYETFAESTAGEVTEYLADRERDYRELKDELIHRERTLLIVTKLLVKVQWRYLMNKQNFIEPLILRDIANQANLSESTISRTISEKYIEAPRGILPLSALFTRRSKVSQSEVSMTREEQLIQLLVSRENGAYPLSDQQIAVLLSDEGIKLSRRTVTKYRQRLGILNRRDRKRL